MHLWNILLMSTSIENRLKVNKTEERSHYKIREIIKSISIERWSMKSIGLDLNKNLLCFHEETHMFNIFRYFSKE